MQEGVSVMCTGDEKSTTERTHVIVMGVGYPVRIEADPIDGGFAVFSEGSPTCGSQGETREECLENIADAINECLLGRKDMARKRR